MTFEACESKVNNTLATINQMTLLEMSDLTEAIRLLVVAIDEQGKEFAELKRRFADHEGLQPDDAHGEPGSEETIHWNDEK